MSAAPASRQERRLLGSADELVYLAGLAFAVAWRALKPSTWSAPVREVLARQVYLSGVTALGLVAAIAALVGLGVVLQTRLWLVQFGQSALIGQVLVVVVVRELAPLLVNMIVIVRSGSMIATELGTMAVRGEVEALDAQGVDPLHYLVVPRVVGVAIAAPCLTVFFDLIAFATGYAASVLLELHPAAPMAFVDQVLEPLRGADVVSSLLKCMLPPMLVAVLCCDSGLRVERTPTAVPRAASRALLASILTVFFLTVLITAISYP